MIKILNSLSGYLSYLRSQFHYPETVLAWYTVYSIPNLGQNWDQGTVL